MHKVFGERRICDPVEESGGNLKKAYTRTLVDPEHLSQSATFQCYVNLSSLTDLVTYLQQKICPKSSKTCYARAAALQFADYIDLDYEDSSQTVVLTSLWHRPPLEQVTWIETISDSHEKGPVEVGVLANELSVRAGEVSLGGFLVVIGKDERPSTSRNPFGSSC